MYGLKIILPSIYTSLHSGKDNQIVIEVLTQLDVHRVRGIALTPYSGIIERMARVTDGKELKSAGREKDYGPDVRRIRHYH